MRKMYTEETLWSTPKKEIKILKSRHELSYVLPGLIHILEERRDIIEQVHKDLTAGKSNKKGREGMPAVMALTLLVVRNTIQGNYAELEWMLHNDKTLLALLGDNPINPIKLYDEKTIHQNLNKISFATIEAINNAVIKSAQKEGFEKGGNIRGDSFVCKRNIHTPSESTLLYDCARVIIRNCEKIDTSIIGRQEEHHLRKIKATVREIGGLRRSKRSKEKKEKEMQKAHTILIGQIKTIIKRVKKNAEIAREILEILADKKDIVPTKYIVISTTTIMAEAIIELTKRRVLLNEEIPNREKILSIFETEVELINRGKYPIAIEFGHKIFVHQSESGFIVDWAIMGAGKKDSEQIEPSIERIKKNYGIEFNCGSYDKGFHTPENQKELPKLFLAKKVVIPKKGKRTEAETEREHTKDFIKLKFFRAGVESLISSLVRGNGMGLCPDRGMSNYKKYTACCILSRNLHTLGNYLIERENAVNKKAG